MSKDDAAKDHLIDGKYAIGDLVDMGELRAIFEKFTQATGFTTGFLDHPGLNVLIATGWRDICTKFHRTSPASAAICTKSNRHLLDQLKEPDDLIIESCDNGLVDCAVPIIVKGKHIASLATGQLLLEEPDIDRFRQQAELFGFDVHEYLEALKDVPVVSEERVRTAAAFLGQMAHSISRLGYSSLIAKEKSLRLENEISERKKAEAALQISEARVEHLNDVLRAIRHVSSLLNREKDPGKLLTTVCNSFAQTRGYVMVWIGQPEAGSKRVVPVAHSGVGSEFLEHSLVTWDDSSSGQGPAGTAMRERRPVVFNDLANDPRFAPWKEPVTAYGGASIASVPLIYHERLFGVLTVMADRPHAFDAEEVDLLSGLAADMARVLQGLEDEAVRKQMGEALKESENLYRSLFENMLNGFAYCKMIFEGDGPKDFIYLNVNSAFETLTGLKNVIGKKVSEVIPGIRESDPDLFEIYGRVTITGIPERFETYLEALGQWFSISVYSPRKEYFVAVFDVITERKLIEEELRESKSKLEAALASMTDAVFISDDQGRFIDFNDAFATYHRFKSKDECAKTLADYHDILDVYMADGQLAPLDQWAVPRALRGETATNAEYTLLRKDTGETWIGSYSFGPIRNKDGEIVGSVVAGRDITERKRTEAALRQSEELYRTLVSLSPDAISVVDINGLLTFTSPKSRQMFGDSPDDDILGRSLLCWVAPEDHEKASANIRHLLTEKTLTATEYTLSKKDGTRFIGEVNAAVIHSPEGRPIGIIIITRDITERKQMEDNLRNAHDSLNLKVRELWEKSENLEEVNTALKVLLKQREEDKKDLGESVLANVRTLINPYVEKLKNSQLSNSQRTLVEILGSHVNEIVSPFCKTLGLQSFNLTPAELRVAGFIRDGKSTDEIAEILCISWHTVSTYRDNIREKLGLRGNRTNLRSYLLSIA